MSRTYRWVILLGLLAAMGIRPASGADLKSLHGHVPAVAAGLKPLGRLAATNDLRLAIGLPLRDEAGLDAFLAQLYDPASTNYHQYLTPEEFADRFGPTEQDYAAIKEFARTNDLVVTTTYRNRLVVDVTAPAATVEKALHITLRTYQHPTESRQFFAPDAEPSIKADLPVADIQGLSDYFKPHPKFRKKAGGGFTLKSGTSPDGTGSYIGDDFRHAYAPDTVMTGAGQMVGLLEFDGFYSNDIAAYATSAGGGRANIPIQTVLLDSFNGHPTGLGNESEVALDIEMAMAMALGLTKIVSFEAGTNGLQNDVLNSMVTFSNSVKQLSCSWGWSGGPSTTTDNIFKNMQARGQSFFNASGDSDAFTTGASSTNGVDNPLLANAPSSSPYIIQVGGTTLTMNGNGDSYASETVWNWDVDFGTNYDGEGSGGGISSFYPRPTWQTNVSNMAGRGGSTTARNTPDVAMVGDEIYVVSGGNGVGSGGTGGTSCSAALWAGFMALVNQQAAAYGKPSAGFINPAVYTLAASANYSACFHDVTTGSNTWSGSPSLFVAQTGYDLCTGVGTPTGQNLINALSGAPDALGVSPLTGYSFSGLHGGPFIPSLEPIQLTNSSAVAIKWSLINTSAWLKATFTNGTLAAHTGTNFNISLTLTATNLAVGSYNTTVGFTDTVSHVVERFPFALRISQPVAVSPGTGFTAIGPVGGPFTPGSQNFVLTNFGNTAIAWSIIKTSTWLTVSATNGSLALLGSTNVTVSVSSAANSLAAAVYNASLVFTNPLGRVAAVPFSLFVGQPIVRNGGFETGDFTGWVLSGNSSSTEVTSGSTSSAYIHSGTYSAALGPVGSPGYLTQNLTTSAGQNYLLSLWVRNPTGLTPNLFQVQWNGTTLSSGNITGTNWANLEFSVTAASNLTPLQFSFQDDPDFLGLDDISVTPLAPVTFKSFIKLADNFQLVWNTTTGIVYQVQYRTNLVQADWINLGSATTAKTNTLAITDTNALQHSPQRYYRLLVTP